MAKVLWGFQGSHSVYLRLRVIFQFHQPRLRPPLFILCILSAGTCKSAVHKQGEIKEVFILETISFTSYSSLPNSLSISAERIMFEVVKYEITFKCYDINMIKTQFCSFVRPFGKKMGIFLRQM